MWKYVAVVLAASLLVPVAAQVAKRRAVSQGPRAVALVEVDSKGRAHLIPVTIMIDGRFYDASIYKADPVPMALQPETVYEGFKSGVSQGLFTVGSAIEAHGWLGLGTWKSNEQIEAEKKAKQERAAKLAQTAPQDITAGGPPRLSRSPQSAPKNQPATTTSQPGASTSEPSDRPVLKKPKSVDEASSSASLAAAEADRPVLRRPAPGEVQQTKTDVDSSPLQGPLQIIPAISDADGPKPRPYDFQLKPGEEQDFTKKMTDMAADEVRKRAALLPGNADKKNTRAPTAPAFQNTQLRVMDISNTNEAVLVFTGSASLPGRADVQYRTAVVARQDIYGDLHKVMAQTTDNKHLDIQPEYDFIDVVDVDGDGRGELLFRQVWDSGSGFAIYRVIGDRLWPLFESKPAS